METTLNLLPPDKKHSLHTALAMAFVQSLTLFVVAVVLLVAVTLVALRMTLSTAVEDMSKRSTATIGEYTTLTQHMRGINDYISRMDGVHAKFIDWSAVLESLGHSAPNGLRFEGISISPDMTVTLEGTAKTRDDVLGLERQLKSSPQFTDITSPLSNILQKENLRFEFRMKFIPPNQE